ncbi:hypothetical protein N0V90_006461 [Kalmusia sp. IMI 367209]|nr:hypothetical protein N0V90_006461 [Kalmusia sp. IMI 367209]
MRGTTIVVWGVPPQPVQELFVIDDQQWQHHQEVKKELFEQELVEKELVEKELSGALEKGRH